MANVTDKITDVRNAARPASTTVSSPRSAGGVTLACVSLIGWPTASKVHFVTYKIDSNSNPITDTQQDCSGIVSGSNIGSLTVVDPAVDTGNSIGDVVEMLPTAAWGQDLADALMAQHGRTGLHTSAAAITIGNLLYPVGSIYTATVSTNPATLLGFGTWGAFGVGRVLVGVGTSDAVYAAGATGGESTHVLSTPEMPAHTHNIGDYSNTGHQGTGFNTADVVGDQQFASGSAGGGGAHNNLQPYIVVYMWLRSA